MNILERFRESVAGNLPGIDPDYLQERLEAMQAVGELAIREGGLHVIPPGHAAPLHGDDLSWQAKTTAEAIKNAAPVAAYPSKPFDEIRERVRAERAGREALAERSQEVLNRKLRGETTVHPKLKNL